MTRKQFKLKEVSIEKGVVKYSAVITTTSGDETFEKVISAKETRFPHPDLTDKFNDTLKIVAIKVMGYAVPMEMLDKSPGVTTGEIDAVKQLAFRIKEIKDKIVENTTVVGIKLNGVGDTSGVVIEHRYKPFTGKETRVKTPSITLKASTYGIEEMLNEAIETVEEEVYEYVFEDKISQTEIGFDD